MIILSFTAVFSLKLKSRKFVKNKNFDFGGRFSIKNWNSIRSMFYWFLRGCRRAKSVPHDTLQDRFFWVSGPFFHENWHPNKSWKSFFWFWRPFFHQNWNRLGLLEAFWRHFEGSWGRLDRLGGVLEASWRTWRVLATISKVSLVTSREMCKPVAWEW